MLNVEEVKNEEDHASIRIDKKEYRSPNPTVGAALYILAGIDAATYDLYRETHTQGDDELIPNDKEELRIENADQFFSIKKKLNPGGVACH